MNKKVWVAIVTGMNVYVPEQYDSEAIYPGKNVLPTFETEKECQAWIDENPYTLSTNMTKEQAFKIFVKHGSTFRSYNAKDIFQYAWYSQYWDGKGSVGSYTKKDWMTEDLLAAFVWYLDQVGRAPGWNVGRAKGLMPYDEMKQFEKDLEKVCREKEHAKWASQAKSKKKRDEKLSAQGEEFLKDMQIGEVYMVKFNSWWNERGMQVLEIDPGCISGFYLDHVETVVPGDAPEKPGYMYTKPSKYNSIKVNGEYVPGKYEWDGKTFRKTRTYETKMAKFIKRKVESPVINKI